MPEAHLFILFVEKFKWGWGTLRTLCILEAITSHAGDEIRELFYVSLSREGFTLMQRRLRSLSI